MVTGQMRKQNTNNTAVELLSLNTKNTKYLTSTAGRYGSDSVSLKHIVTDLKTYLFCTFNFGQESVQLHCFSKQSPTYCLIVVRCL